MLPVNAIYTCVRWILDAVSGSACRNKGIVPQLLEELPSTVSPHWGQPLSEENSLTQGYSSFQGQPSPWDKVPALLPYLRQLPRVILSSELLVELMESATETA